MKHRTREGKKNTSFKKVDDKANFDVTENPTRYNKPRPEREKWVDKPVINKELRNKMYRDFNKAKE